MTQRRTNTKNIHIPFIILLFGLTFLIFINTSSAAASAVDNIIYVNGTSGDDTWDGQNPIWNGTSGPKLTIKNATDTVNTGGTVNIAEGTYSGSGNTNIIINKDLTINGAGIDQTIINGTDSTRIFYINPGYTVNINGLTITNGKSDLGGAILNYGNLNVDYCKFTKCTTIYKFMCGGSAIASGDYSTLNVKNSIFLENDAISSLSAGGTIYTNGTTTLENCDFLNNLAWSGGAIFVFSGDLNAYNCKFINNTAQTKGGVMTIYTDSNSFNIHGCAFINNVARNTASTNNINNTLGSYLNITDNWWGSNSGPTGVFGLISDGSSWIYMISSVDSSTTDYGGQINVKTDFNNIYHRDTGTITQENVGSILDGFSVDFSSDMGNLTPIQGLIAAGIANSVFTANKVGTGNITSSFNIQSLNNTITVNKAATLITVNNTTGLNNGTTNLTATLTDANGNPIDGKTVNFTVDGNSAGTATTDSNGVATLTYKPTQAGDLVVAASFAGDSDYLTSTGSGALHVDPTANLYLDATSSNSNPSAGQEFLITYKLGNYGPDAAENVIITFTIPEGLDYVEVSADSGRCSYDPTTRTVTWTLDNVPQGDPFLYLTVRAFRAGTYTLTPTISTATYNWKTGSQGIFNLNIKAAGSSSNSSNTVKAATKTITMSKTGANPIGLVMAILAVLGGILLPRKK